jgi:hypothetical protein
MADNHSFERGEEMATIGGECFCGAVKIEVSGQPEAMGYCHCRSCRSWSGGPVNAFTLWKPDAVRVTAGAEHIATFSKTPASERQYCRICGGHLMTNHPALGMGDVFSATVPTLAFAPAVHVNYAETVLPMRDGLPKFKDFPGDIVGAPIFRAQEQLWIRSGGLQTGDDGLLINQADVRCAALLDGRPH